MVMFTGLKLLQNAVAHRVPNMNLRKMARNILPVVLPLVMGLTPVYAQESACAAKIRDCFSLSGVQRSICFQVTSRLEPCRGTPDGALAARRGAYSPLATPEALDNGADTPPEPLIFDKECVANFDSLWLSHLVNDDHSPETCDSLLSALNECSRQPTFELLRP
jgi:hypothetical protein